MKILYKKDTVGKIRYLKMYTEDHILVQEAGVVGSDKFTKNPRVCTPKNIGKKNETTGAEQAIAEMNSKYTKKLREGYFLTEEEAKNSNVILPMLAKEYKKEKHKIDWKNDDYIILQPKLDGMRCLAFIDGKGGVKLVSRKNVDIIQKHNNSMQHIVDELSKIKEECILDGELYTHGHTFQEIMTFIKSNNDDNTKVQFCVYDVVSDSPYVAREGYIAEVLTEYQINSKIAQQVFGNNIKKEKEVKEGNAISLGEGYEGSMIRYGDAGYKVNGRSSNLLKYKDFIDIACPIIDIVPANSNPKHGVPVCMWNGHEFRAGCKLSHAEREDLLTNKHKYIGKMAEIRYFEETDDGKPRFPVFHGIRLDK